MYCSTCRMCFKHAVLGRVSMSDLLLFVDLHFRLAILCLGSICPIHTLLFLMDSVLEKFHCFTSTKLQGDYIDVTYSILSSDLIILSRYNKDNLILNFIKIWKTEISVCLSAATNVSIKTNICYP